MISCSKASASIAPGTNLSTYIVIFLMAIVLLVIIALILIFWYLEYQKKYKSITIPESSESLTTESGSVSTVDTIKSGLTKGMHLFDSNYYRKIFIFA